MATEKKTEIAENPEVKIDDGEEIVEREYFYDGKKYKDDIYVSVGNEEMYVKRGERVKLKKKFADRIEESILQDQKADKFMVAAMTK